MLIYLSIQIMKVIMGYIITPFFSRWLIKEENSFDYINAHFSKEDAIVEASILARNNKTDLTVFNNESMVESSISYSE
jgi:hypothetical protein